MTIFKETKRNNFNKLEIDKSVSRVLDKVKSCIELCDDIKINKYMSSEISFENRCAPLFKWPGGKRRLLNSIFSLIPSKINTYYEPFLGGGALYFAIQPNKAVLSDTNSELINCYSKVRECPQKIIHEIRGMENSEKNYYLIRSWKPRGNIQKAARLLYLINLSFNGIYRVNLKGKFNVPYGYKTHIDPCNEPLIYSSSKALKNTLLKVDDFERATRNAGKNDLIYFDPPYTVAHGNNCFIKYNERIFSWDDQKRLANYANLLSKRGCFVIVSNASHPAIMQLYRGFSKKIIFRYSLIAASRENRKLISEVLFYKGGINDNKYIQN